MEDEEWCDDGAVDGSDAMITATVHSMSDKLYNDGYRVGRSMADDVQMQRGFDSGFSRGIAVGKACGRLYAAAAKTFSIASLSSEDRSNAEQSLYELERLLLTAVPGSDHGHLLEVVEGVEQLVLPLLASNYYLPAELKSFKEVLLGGSG
jgi:hypothetical protein